IKSQEFRNELAELEAKLQDPSIYSSPEYPRYAKRVSELQEIISTFEEVAKFDKQLEESKELSKAGGELAELAELEIEELSKKLNEASSKLNDLLIPKDPNNERNAIIEIRAAAGGDESSLFAAELYRMYARY